MSIEATDLARAEAAYTAAVQAAAGNRALWDYARQAHEVCKQLRTQLGGEAA
jgi:hypothetical protein